MGRKDPQNLMADVLEIPPRQMALRDQVVTGVAQTLRGSYSPRDLSRFSATPQRRCEIAQRHGSGTTGWPIVSCMLDRLQELVMPGYFGISDQEPAGEIDCALELNRAADDLYAVLKSYFSVEFEEKEAQERASLAALRVIQRLPEFRQRALWNVFASLRDPAVWDAFILRDESRRNELARLEPIEAIDAAIRGRDPHIYLRFLKENGFEYVYAYQRRLVKRSYPGWRALLMHDIAHTLALGGAIDGIADAGPTPFLPRIITEQVASRYQADFHPECVIGDANFVEHPHRGITLGQTGRIGIGCILYPCTLGGVTDKVKMRHPQIGDFVLIGTDVGIFGMVEVGEKAVIGANTEIYGYVTIGSHVKMGSAVVARTVRTADGAPGRLIFEEGTVIGDESLIINDQPTDLVIPAHSTIPPHCFLTNDGTGRPRISQ